MATDRFNVCSDKSCGHREQVFRLFDALRDIQQGRARCSECGKRSYLSLTFPFGNGQYPTRYKVLAVFLPKHLPRSWPEGKYKRGFYPFLVILEKVNDGHCWAWLPYWHVDKNRRGHIVRVKYGQWASVMRDGAFASLIKQARAKPERFS